MNAIKQRQLTERPNTLLHRRPHSIVEINKKAIIQWSVVPTNFSKDQETEISSSHSGSWDQHAKSGRS
jgi:hypothetical protein